MTEVTEEAKQIENKCYHNISIPKYIKMTK